MANLCHGMITVKDLAANNIGLMIDQKALLLGLLLVMPCSSGGCLIQSIRGLLCHALN